MTVHSTDLVPFPAQLEAIEAPSGPTLVLAGPGAGKTFCLIRRVAYLIEKLDVAPQRICTVTFTNKAAEEVTTRLHGRLGSLADRISRGTLHALCLGLLREHPEELGLRRGFGVADDEYQKLLLRRLNVWPEKRRGHLLNLFGRHRLEGYELTEGDEALFESYLSLLREKNLVDFDDIITLTERLLREHPAIADEMASRWDHLLIDEFQDLDATQYAIIKRLAEEHRNIFAVGDDEQSIFSWRGSDPRILWRFATEFEAREIILDKNCRCSRQIFEVARRLMRENPELFRKEITAERDAPYEVAAYGFEDEAAETAWIIEDILNDRTRSSLSWGDYAVLYRQHFVGRYLESRLVAAGLPCRLARGRSLLDDPVVAYVVASLRLVTAPDDPINVEAFAERMLPHALMAEVRTLAGREGVDLLAALRSYARNHPRMHPDTKKAWRFIYHVENLRALYESHDTLAGLVDELLSQRVKPYENRLEEHYEELEDPLSFPGAAELADALRATVNRGGRVWIRPRGGVEIALRGMLMSVGIPVAIDYLLDEDDANPADLVLDSEDERPRPLTTTAFKALQLIHSRDFAEVLTDFVAFDLETTDLDPMTCEIVEIGAARVRDGRVVDTFHSLVRPDRPVTASAAEVHGYTEAELADAPPLAQVWPRLAEFVGDDVLVAHNGLGFDVPVLRRQLDRFTDSSNLVFFDTLPLARSLFRESARLGDLAERFAVGLERAHHALDDAVALAEVYRELGARKRERARKAALVNLLDFVGLGLALEPWPGQTDEDRLLRNLAVPFALGRYSDCLDYYEGELEQTAPGAPEMEEVIARLGGRKVMERIRAERRPAERYPAAVARLRALIEVSGAETLEESAARFLERVALSTSEGVEADPHRVNLLTLHSTKGLEFSRVYVVGVEDYQMPGYYAALESRTDETNEARRLLYVGMTRARDRLVLTRTDRRRGKDSGGALFLDELALSPTRP
ncbi:MAG: UvrD-helicase domain-containing protein [Gemmatimonadetes bacterium]|uniref:DNA 3'-5' helicase n=1 Tax=Candidatus Kutchimonas denitrificans TaxID=3056748 RepID=A0AAE4ZAB6_9BACT|nr:UvrD-helicase domain-containing protein [Gemmatimonadota bacterium]NIR74456.1 UvrD-helicase domain-containing protein [Candidatus Kutchimonas denitrificans]NIS00852.1 UvrD-helicase domain-containing protein [Gemmatimonadota bacterium]NIT66475.1 UvrD-helicase domain-containing protein [Gemmatimonadota bacterium]NIU52106.1 UvrD-helicase domain-containing protein [Gemmatimonadota bacterium]